MPLGAVGASDRVGGFVHFGVELGKELVELRPGRFHLVRLRHQLVVVTPSLRLADELKGVRQNLEGLLRTSLPILVRMHEHCLTFVVAADLLVRTVPTHS